MKKFALFAIAISLSTAAHAFTEFNKTISYLGVQNSVAYVAFNEGLSQTCAWGNLYVDLTTDGGRALYSMLLTAKSTNKLITRLDYTITNGTCNANLFQI